MMQRNVVKLEAPAPAALASFGILAALAVAVSGCALIMFPWQGVPATPRTLVYLGETAFFQFGIPVERSSAIDGVVESGRFQVVGTWDGEPIEDRIDCGEEAGEPRARHGTITMQVRLRAIERSPVRLEGGLRPWSTLKIAGSGTLETPDGERHDCDLDGDFKRLIVSVISSATGTGVAARPPRLTDAHHGVVGGTFDPRDP